MEMPHKDQAVGGIIVLHNYCGCSIIAVNLIDRSWMYLCHGVKGLTNKGYTGNNNPNEALLISVQHCNQYVITEKT